MIKNIDCATLFVLIKVRCSSQSSFSHSQLFCLREKAIVRFIVTQRQKLNFYFINHNNWFSTTKYNYVAFHDYNIQQSEHDEEGYHYNGLHFQDSYRISKTLWRRRQFISTMNYWHLLDKDQLKTMSINIRAAHLEMVSSIESKIRAAKHTLSAIDYHINRNELELAKHYMEKVALIHRSLIALGDHVSYNKQVQESISRKIIRVTSPMTIITISDSEKD